MSHDAMTQIARTLLLALALSLFSGVACAQKPLTVSTLSTADGTASAPSLTYTNDANTGSYRIGADEIGWAVGGNGIARLTAGAFAPHSNNAFTLGTSALRWSTVYGVAGNYSGTVTAGAVSAASIYSSATPGNPPLVVDSDEKVDNLNADLIDGIDGADIQQQSDRLDDIAALTPTNTYVIMGNGTTWTSQAVGGGGLGDVVGPASATDNAPVRFDGTTGKLVQNTSNLTILDTGVIASAVSTGTAPFTVASTTKVTNLDADTVDGESANAFQDVDLELTALAGTTSAANKLPYYTGTGSATTADFTAFARTILDDADASTVRTTIGAQALSSQLTTLSGLAPTDGNFIVGDGAAFTAESGATARASLGLTIGTHVQAYDTELAAIAGTTSAADTFPYYNGSGTATTATLTAFARTILDDADAATVRTTIGAAAAAGAGDVVGPASATDNAFARFDSTTGKLVQNSAVTADDNGLISVPTTGGVSFGAGGTWFSDTLDVLELSIQAATKMKVTETSFTFADDTDAAEPSPVAGYTVTVTNENGQDSALSVIGAAGENAILTLGNSDDPDDFILTNVTASNLAHMTVNGTETLRLTAGQAIVHSGDLTTMPAMPGGSVLRIWDHSSTAAILEVVAQSDEPAEIHLGDGSDADAFGFSAIVPDGEMQMRVAGASELSFTEAATAPVTNSGQALGTSTTGWDGLFLRQDTASTPVATIQTAPSATTDGPSRRVYQYDVTTTDATLTTLAQIALDADSANTVTVTVTARKTNATAGNYGSYRATFGAALKGSTPTINGSASPTTLDFAPVFEDDASWSVIAIPFGTTGFRLRVTGAASNTISWTATVEVDTIND